MNNRHRYSSIIAALLVILSAVLPLFTPSVAYAAGNITGTAFRDYNNDGTKGATDPGIEGVIVTIFDTAGASCTTNTIADGSYDINSDSCAGGGLADGFYRVEFTLPASLDFLEAAPVGTNNNSTVQFVADSGVANVAFHNPAQYSQSNPRVAIPLLQSGTGIGNDNGASGIVTFDYEATGSGQQDRHATADEVGTVWGIAHQQGTNNVFAASFLRRHSGFADGPGYLYWIDGFDENAPVVPLNLQGITPQNGGPTIDLGSVCRRSATDSDADETCAPQGGDADEYVLPDNRTSPSRDIDAFGKVGTISFGDLEVSEDGNTLWAVNLNQRTLISIAVNAIDSTTFGALTGSSINQYWIDVDSANPVNNTYPRIGGNVPCVNGDFRPWALSFNDGKGYLGGVCSAEDETATTNATVPGTNIGPTRRTNANLRAYVLAFDPKTPTAGFTTVLDFPLNYLREAAYRKGGNPTTSVPSEWQPWAKSWSDVVNLSNISDGYGYAQPILSDIQFSDDGSMVLGLLDRFSAQFGIQNHLPVIDDNTLTQSFSAGDLLRACRNGSNFVIEGGSGCALPPNHDQAIPSNQFDNDGPSGAGEYFFDEVYSDLHGETAQGALAWLPGSGETFAVVMDPIIINSGGAIRFDSTTAQRINNGYQVFTGKLNTGAITGVFGKAAGLGDMELLRDLAPLEIGNRVWLDRNGNGVQDANEAGIQNVEVQLWVDTDNDNTPDTQVGTATTNNQGEYYFGGLTNANLNRGVSLLTHTAYEVRVNTVQLPLTGLLLTTPNADGSANGDSRDSDATLVSSVATIPYTTGNDGENDHTLDLGFLPLASVGNYVWVDEDSDGYQDAGEPGIPNVRVVLKDENGTEIDHTWTDSHGGYLFDDLPPGNYFVDVDESTIPTGYTQTPPSTLPGADFGNQDHSGNGYPVSLEAGEENLTADFGYNANPAPDVNTPNGAPLAALGDRVWIDSDGDGVQDVAEIGVEGVELTLYTPGPDGLFGTPDDVPQSTTTTDENGYYLFDGLTPGAYVVVVTDSSTATHNVLDTAQYDQTGDPDHFAAVRPLNTTDDNRSTLPVVLEPGDVFLNVDFGYQPEDSSPTVLGSIGDTVWFDADTDGNGPSIAPVDGGAPVTQGAGGTADASEYGIAGVTVALIRDTNGNDVWDDGEPIIATDITDANGQYLFSDLPLGDYIVWVNDSQNVLDGLVPTYDADGLGTPDRSARTLTSGDANPRDQDFGYTPQNHDDKLGLIGDTIWFDSDSSGGDQSTKGDEPGIEGVLVYLYTSGPDEDFGTGDDILIATTVTDENGHYLFGGLPLEETYQVRVAPENFNPGGVLEGLSNTYDPDGTTPLNAGNKVELTEASPINLLQDFSYVYVPAQEGPVGRIGNLVWLDPNGDGLYQANGGDGLPGTEDDETPIGGVTVDLYRDLNGNGQVDPNEPRIGNTVTSSTLNALYGADGNYIFTGLPAGDYVVDVSDRDGVLAGYWKSDGPNAGQNNNSQLDPYAVSLEAGEENLTADFGYYTQPAGVGNWVWYDSNANGLQDDGETGINNVPITLTITYSDGAQIVLHTLTQNDPVGNNPGWYSFGNLLLDEDYNGLGDDAEPTFVITAGNVAGYTRTLINQGVDDTEDSDNHAGVDANPVQGQTNTARANDGAPIASYDFGFADLASLGDRVWYDNDKDGEQDSAVDEPGVPGVLVTIYDAGTDTPIQRNGHAYTQTTDINGLYLFTDLVPGEYYVVFDVSTLPAQYTLTTANQGGVGEDKDSDADSTGKTNSVTLALGQNYLDLDAGIVAIPPASLGDRVWYDNDQDGEQDNPSDEPGVSGVVVTVYDADSDTPVQRDGHAYTLTTDIDGLYLFTDLVPGNYYVVFDVSTLPTNYTLTTPNQSGVGEDVDSDADNTGKTNTVSLSPAQSYLDLDAGIVPLPASLGDRVWYDNDQDGAQDNPADEPGVSGVMVTVYDAGTDSPVQRNGQDYSLTTDIDGLYLFTDLVPGNYYVIFDVSTLPANYVLTTANQGGVGEDVDSDADNTGKTNTVSLSPAQSYLDLDAGIVPLPASLGDRVWIDTDRDGEQDEPNFEPGVPGVMVTVYDANTNTPVERNGQPYTQTTDASGLYLFTNLIPGSYYVIFDLNTLPVNYTLTTSNQNGVNEAADSDPDSTGKTETVSLSAGQMYLNLDAGIVEISPVAVGDRVWYDNDRDGVQDSADAEPGVEGVVVTVYDAGTNSPVLVNGQPYTQTTDVDGLYLFTNLRPGSYYVIFDFSTLPGNYIPTTANQGQDDADSDADVNGQTGATPSLPAGSQDLTLDLGIVQPTPQLLKQADRPVTQAGDTLVYTLTYTNTSGAILRNAYIEETVPEHTTMVAALGTAGWSCADGSAAGTKCIIELGNLAPNSSGHVLFGLKIDSNLPGALAEIENTAGLGSRNNPNGTPPPPTITSRVTTPLEGPTAEEETDQPGGPRSLFLPNIEN